MRLEILETVANPSIIYGGKYDVLLGVREIDLKRYLVVVYRELKSNDGFVITSFITSKKKYFQGRKQIWPT